MLLNFTEQAQRVAMTRQGGPDVLQVVEADLPERRAGEVRVKVLAPQFLPTISCSGAQVLPPTRRACRSPQERTSLAWWAQVDTTTIYTNMMPHIYRQGSSLNNKHHLHSKRH
jgi:hypothetical protein